MKRGLVAAAALCMAVALAACNGAPTSAGSSDGIVSEDAVQEQRQQVTIKQSPDKYTWYVKDYVGMNAASVGYTALDGLRRDAYGAGTLKVVFRSTDGTYVPIDVDAETGEENDELKNYKVIGQDLAPNTELKYTFQRDGEGVEYDSLVDTQNYDEIVLAVAPVASQEPAPDLTVINASPDKYTRYVKDYTGRNLAVCGYVSLAGTYNDRYGAGFIQFDITAEDGSFVDVGDEEALKTYVVTAQGVAPNTPITMTFSTDSNGVEYSNLVDTQSIENITLTVAALDA